MRTYLQQHILLHRADRRMSVVWRVLAVFARSGCGVYGGSGEAAYRWCIMDILRQSCCRKTSNTVFMLTRESEAQGTEGGWATCLLLCYYTKRAVSEGLVSRFRSIQGYGREGERRLPSGGVRVSRCGYLQLAHSSECERMRACGRSAAWETVMVEGRRWGDGGQ